MPHTYEHAWSVKKPSSESHAWSYKHACDACLAEIEVRHGVDWKVTDVVFEDLGRETETDVTWDGKRTWKCTHRVKATYEIVHRGNPELDVPIFENHIKITYKMHNVNYK
ncbi:hypothetical protein [Bacillus cereus]|uniref:Uncharacterized protein n=1 Tax=Bacillus cereus (strain VD014) TaxID=1053223 RepID=A0A9W5K1B0_BACC8|nr:hypothetical protein [Bacillus cereus]EJR11753.1 hypothetical protein IIA_05860 [Bacillus cereus VD014]